MSAFGGFAKPGQGAAIMTSEREIFAQGFESNRSFFKSACVSGVARDAGNSPTTILRSGLLLGQITSSGKFIQWDITATDGSQNLAGILWKELRATDFDANNTDRVFTIIQGMGLMQAAQLLIKGVALVGHADEFLARRSLAAMGFWLDDDMNRAQAGMLMRTVAKAADYTVLTSDNGTLFTNTGAAAKITFTLPAIKKGLKFSFYSTDNDGIKILASTADTIVAHNDVDIDYIDLATTGRNIGGRVDIEANEDASLWLATPYVWNIADDGSTTTKFALTD